MFQLSRNLQLIPDESEKWAIEYLKKIAIEIQIVHFLVLRCRRAATTKK